MTRFLIISLCLLFLDCGSYPKKQGFKETSSNVSNFFNPYFSDETIDYVYKAKIDIYDNHFSGLLIVKKIEDHNHRLAFTTEMGNKLFDFSFVGSDFNINYIVDDFDKSLLIKILKEDFKALITETLKKENNYNTDLNTVYETSIYNKTHFYFYKDGTLDKIKRVKGSKEKVFFQFSNISDSIAKQIEITHYNIKLNITLNSIFKL